MKPKRPDHISAGARVALVTPTFHNLHAAIAHGLQQLDLRVATVVYDARDSVAQKLREKIRTDVPDRLGRDILPALRARTTAQVHAALSALDYDFLLVVKGDVIDAQLIADQNQLGKRTIAWLYDAMANTHHSFETLSVYDSVGSFSPSDVAKLQAAGLDTRFVPLAADARLMRTPPMAVHGPDVVFFGARYGQREQVLTYMHSRGYSVMAYGRDWSRHPRDRIRSLSWHRPNFPTRTDLTREHIAAVSSDAVCVLNMHNLGQDGFNLRTFEVPGAAGLQLIDRADISQFYEPETEVIQYRTLDDVEGAIERAKNDPDWVQGVRTAAWRRTLAEHTFSHRVATLLTDHPASSPAGR